MTRRLLLAILCFSCARSTAPREEAQTPSVNVQVPVVVIMDDEKKEADCAARLLNLNSRKMTCEESEVSCKDPVMTPSIVCDVE